MYLLLLASLLATSTLFIGQNGPSFTGKLVVDNVGITNDSLVSSEDLLQLRQEITKQQYEETAEIGERARYALQKKGYFKADVTTSDLQVLNETPGENIVAVTLRVNEGRQYRLERINFAHNSVFTSSKLREAFAIKDQDVFDVEKIRLGFDELRRLYASEGYINFVPVPNTEPNDQAGTVALLVDIDEGKQFKIESLIIRGKWSETDQARLANIFHSYAGGFNVSGLIEQLKAATLAMLPGLASADGLVEVRQNVESGTVIVSLTRPATR